MAENTENPFVAYKNFGVLDLPNSNNDTPWVIVYNTITGRFDRRDISTLPSVVPTLAAVLAEGNVSGTPVLINNGTEQTGLYHNGLVYSAAEGEVFIGFTEPSENRTILFPNASGTVALLSDIPEYSTPTAQEVFDNTSSSHGVYGFNYPIQFVSSQGENAKGSFGVNALGFLASGGAGGVFLKGDAEGINVEGTMNIYSAGQPDGIWSAQETGGTLVYSYNGTPKFAIDPNGNLTIANNDSFVGTFDPSNITENKTYMLPNNDGELALKEFTVPLSGTEEDKPITGTIEFEDSDVSGEKGIKGNYVDNEFSILFTEEGSIKIKTLATGANSEVVISATGIASYMNGQLISNTSITRGLVGGNDNTANIQELDYTQKKYVDRNSIKRLFSTGSAGVTTTGSETIAYAVPIKATDIGEGVMTFETILSKVGGAGNGTIKVYRSNSATSVSGALQLMTFTTSSSQRTVPIKRDNIILRNGTNQSLIYSTTTAASTEGNSSSNLENINYDFSVDHFLLFTVTSSSGDTIRLESLKVLFYKNV